LGDLSNYKTTRLKKGWNQFLIKIERIIKPLEAHFVIGGIHPSCEKNHGVTVFGIDQSRFIWEV
jgi:ribosomal protein L35AE/L33A